ncbi:MAG: 4'-phosphopantetheinyl transferase superfamily protein [Syntrophomonadaceae bacterium]|nr:4'-phosphopantetheinyl transferase superfamily protein [Syntrophomonadaceae bacterium]
MVEAFVLNIDQIKNLDLMKHLISPKKQERLDKIKHLPSAKQILAGEILARSVIRSKLGIKNSDIMFDYNDYGKPRLQNVKDFHFNLSHSGDWAVMAISSAEVGIDIEQVISLDLTIAEHIFSPYEKQQLSSKPATLQLDYFFQLWTLKESYIKMIGYGLSAALDSFSIQIREGNEFPRLLKIPPEKVYFRQYRLQDNYIIAVCSRNNTFSSMLTEINQDFVHNT